MSGIGLLLYSVASLTWNMMSSGDNHVDFANITFLSGKILDIVSELTILLHSLLSFIVYQKSWRYVGCCVKTCPVTPTSYPLWSPSLPFLIALY